MVELDSVARDDRDGSGGMDDRLQKKVQTQLGVLALSSEQCAVDCLGMV